MTFVDQAGSTRVPALVPRAGRRYAAVWCTQVLAMFTAAVTNLAIGTFVYYRLETGSLLLLGVAYVLSFIPFIVAAPLAGPLVDRWGPRRSLVTSGVGTAVLLAVLAGLLATDLAGEWCFWLVIFGTAAFKALQICALETLVPTILPKRHIGRANSSRMLLTAVSAVLAAVTADALTPVIDITLIAVGALVLVLVALAVVVAAALPSGPDMPAYGRSTGAGLREVLGYLRARRGLVVLLGFFAVVNFVIGFVEVGNRHVVAAFAPQSTLNLVLVVGSIGLLASTIGMTIWYEPRRPRRGLVASSVVFAAAAIVGSTRQEAVLIAVAAVVFLGATPVIMAIVSTILHVKTAPRITGGMMGIKNFVIAVAYPAGNVAAVLCTDLAAPLAGGDGTTGSHAGGAVTVLVGTGVAAGRGYALLMMMVGVLTIGAVLAMARTAALRGIDDLPDVTPDDLANTVTRRRVPAAAEE